MMPDLSDNDSKLWPSQIGLLGLLILGDAVIQILWQLQELQLCSKKLESKTKQNCIQAIELIYSWLISNKVKCLQIILCLSPKFCLLLWMKPGCTVVWIGWMCHSWNMKTLGQGVRNNLVLESVCYAELKMTLKILIHDVHTLHNCLPLRMGGSDLIR